VVKTREEFENSLDDVSRICTENKHIIFSDVHIILNCSDILHRWNTRVAYVIKRVNRALAPLREHFSMSIEWGSYSQQSVSAKQERHRRALLAAIAGARILSSVFGMVRQHQISKDISANTFKMEQLDIGAKAQVATIHHLANRILSCKHELRNFNFCPEHSVA